MKPKKYWVRMTSKSGVTTETDYMSLTKCNKLMRDCVNNGNARIAWIMTYDPWGDCAYDCFGILL